MVIRPTASSNPQLRKHSGQPAERNRAIYLENEVRVMFQRRAVDSMPFAILFALVAGVLAQTSHAQTPVFAVTPQDSSIRFSVQASIAIAGKFDKWDATLTFTSPDVTTGVLDIKAQAASVDTGSGMKNDTLKGGDFFNADHDPYITFRSTKIVATGPNTFSIPGTFTIRGVSKPETLNLTVSGEGAGVGEIKGVMAFDRKDYGMNSGIPFIHIANRVEVDVDLHVKRVSGPPLNFKQ
jgi:polyisoprenoid-binding protein YceI